MKRRSLMVLFAVLALRPGLASSQLAPVPDQYEYLQWVGAGDAVVATWGGVLLGPYTAKFTTPLSANFSIYCVDYLHHAGSQWVETTSLAQGQGDGDMGATRLGTAVGSASKYRQAAYLSSLFESWDDFDAVGHVSNKQTIWSGLHAAIWSITSGVTKGSGDTAYWRNYFVSLAVPLTAGDGWYVLSGTADVNGIRYDGQEFLVRTPVSVPEPATLLLIGTGALLLFALATRRKKELSALGA